MTQAIRRACAWACAALLLCAAGPAFARGLVFGAANLRDGPGVLSLRVAPLLGADCLLLGMDGEWVLVDMGKEGDAPAVIKMLEGAGVTWIGVMLNTHPHSDHIGGAPALVKRFEVGRFLTAFPEKLQGSGVLQGKALHAVREAGVPVETIRDGDILTLGGAQIEAMRQETPDVNAASVVLRVTYGDTAFLLASDVKRLSQIRLCERYDLSCDVLKYPHHGQEALADGFLEEASPGFVIINNGSYGSAAAWERLEKEGVRYAFSTWGVVAAFSDGETVFVAQELTPEAVRYREEWLAQGKGSVL